MIKLVRALSATFVLVFALTGSVCAAAAAPVSVRPGNALPTQFPQAPQCVCHRMLLSEWQESMHSKALDDPLFKFKVAEADKATGKKLGPFCRRCHGPVASITGQDGKADVSPAASQGVVCSFCHQVVSTGKPPLANVPHLLDLTGVMRAQLKDAQAPHFTQYSKLHTTSEICGGCHDVNHPGNGLALETTYAEWKKSPQAKQGIQCQDCHMSEEPPVVGPSTGYAAEGAPERPNIYHMTFAGAQVALGNPTRATALLKKAAKVELEAPEVLPAGGAEVSVKVTNVGAGHFLPTGLTEVRQMRLSVVVADADGKETEIGERVFGTEFKDKKGNHPAEIPDAVGVAKDDRIGPGASVSQKFKLTLPAGIQAADVTARLLYKSAPDELAKAAGVENPTTVMAEATKRVFATQEAKAADAANAGAGPSGSTGQAGSGGGLQKGAVPMCLGAAMIAAALAGIAFWRSRKGNGAGNE